MEQWLKDYFPTVKKHEAYVAHFYYDSTENITVGYGFLIKDDKAAEKLSMLKANGSKATKEEKVNDFDNLIGEYKANYKASYYKQFTTLTLDPAFAETELKKRSNEFVSQLTGKFAGFAHFPISAKKALFDLGFNMGVQALWDGFPTLRKHIADKNWAKAATECSRKGIADKRNLETKKLFLAAAKEAKLKQMVVLGTCDAPQVSMINKIDNFVGDATAYASSVIGGLPVVFSQVNESLSEIANSTSMKVQQLLQLNPEILTLTAPLAPSTPILIPDASVFYKVKVGDSMSRIARQYQISLAQIKSFNPQVTNPAFIQLGQQLRVK